MKQLLIFTLFMSSAVALGAGGEHHDGVPVKMIIYQLINVTLIVVGLIYFLKDGVKKSFLDRRASYLAAAEKAETARKAAELERSTMAQRLSSLENTAEESISRARAEAADLKKQMIQEADALSKRLKSEAEQSAKAEVLRAKKEIREELIKQAMETTKAQVEKQVSPEDHTRLQNNFIQNIQVVQK